LSKKKKEKYEKKYTEKRAGGRQTDKTDRGGGWWAFEGAYSRFWGQPSKNERTKSAPV